MYINMKSNYGIETIDQADTLKESRYLLKEYRLSDNYNHYYLSSRATKEYYNTLKGL